MKKNICLALFFIINLNSWAQKFTKTPESKLTTIALESEIRFLASDEMLGRKTGSVTNQVAARYIAEEFRAAGVKSLTGTDYLQKIPFENLKALKKGTILALADTLQMVKNFVAFGGSDDITLQNKEVVFVGYGWQDAVKGIDDYKGLDVKGKIVITRAGNEDAKGPQDLFNAATAKRKFAKEQGVEAIIEIFAAAIPWPTVAGFFSGENNVLADMSGEKRVPLYWVNAASSKSWTKDALKILSLEVPKREKSNFYSSNVVGVIEGTDPVLKNQYVILSAHYDHIGVGKAVGKVTPEDSIFNGTRDNAFGTIALLNTARSFAATKSKRSILLIAFTGEEIGLLGSKYYSEHPLVPLKDCVYNLNCDGAGYNDVSTLTLIGFGRTDADLQITAACASLGLTLKADPAPEQGLFDRSDNVSFASKGIPAPTYSPGFSAFNDDIFKYYHQAADNPETIDFEYLKKYVQVFSYAGRLIANRATAPKWTPGDKYEPAFNELYKK
jgi:Iap family predicted aminopeptidase